MLVRVAAESLPAIDDRHRQQNDLPARPEAIRRLAGLGPKTKDDEGAAAR